VRSWNAQARSRRGHLSVISPLVLSEVGCECGRFLIARKVYSFSAVFVPSNSVIKFLARSYIPVEQLEDEVAATVRYAFS
jgi:hypothetical protein